MPTEPKAPWPHGSQAQPWIGYGKQVSRRFDAWNAIGTAIGIIFAIFGLIAIGLFVFIIFAFSNNTGSNK